ncbi:MAG TPA: capreomycidine synthase [Pyrinomonadaceae bacterium]|nr:capreomycidine synthase [Pyrinomonadaceae bacterium]
MVTIAPALLEEWMREYYFKTEFDIGSSGVQSFSLGQIRELLGITQSELDNIVFDDSETLGGLGLRKAIAERYGNGDPERVIATHGSSEAIFLIMTALLNPGDEVVVLDPCYQQLFSIAKSVGCRLKFWPLRFENGFIPDVEEAKRLITDKTRMVVVNFPHNPTGASLTSEQQEELVKATEAVGAYLVWDAAFAEITYDSARLPDPVQYERSISMGTLSKSFGLPGLRVGWCLASPNVLERFAKLRDYTILHLSPLIELIAQRTIEHAQVVVGERQRQANANLNILKTWCDEHREFVEWIPPRGGVCSFPRLRRISDVETFCHRLARSYGVLLVPGSCFNKPFHVRLGFGGATPMVMEGLSRFSTLLKVTAASAASAS